MRSRHPGWMMLCLKKYDDVVIYLPDIKYSALFCAFLVTDKYAWVFLT